MVLVGELASFVAPLPHELRALFDPSVETSWAVVRDLLPCRTVPSANDYVGDMTRQLHAYLDAER